jgi:hypothetical protein
MLSVALLSTYAIRKMTRLKEKKVRKRSVRRYVR